MGRGLNLKFAYKQVLLVLAVICFTSSSVIFAKSGNVKEAVDFMKTACSAGHSIEIKANGDAGITLFRGGVSGDIEYSFKDARGVVEGLKSFDQSENLNSIRECFKPYIDRILSIMLDDKNS